MPKDDIDISTHDAIRDLTREQLEARFLAGVRELNEDQKELLWLVMQALRRDRPGVAGPDAELIRQCDRLHAVQTAIDATYEITPDNDEQRDVVLDPLNTRWFEIKDRIFEAGGPTTPEGARAAAWVLMDQYPDGVDGAVEDDNLAAWLAIHCAEYLVREPPEIGFGFPVEA
jgi:hypothetical protein